MTEPRQSTFGALLRQRCPRCRLGKVFAGSVTMNRACPVCGLSFEREEGYFLGAMYFSYAFSIVFLGLITLGGSYLLPTWDLGTVVLLAGVVYLPFVPLVFRYSRVVWIHFDRWLWPEKAGPKDP